MKITFSQQKDLLALRIYRILSPNVLSSAFQNYSVVMSSVEVTVMLLPPPDVQLLDRNISTFFQGMTNSSRSFLRQFLCDIIHTTIFVTFVYDDNSR